MTDALRSFTRNSGPRHRVHAVLDCFIATSPVDFPRQQDAAL
jgi:hypothetical protein